MSDTDKSELEQDIRAITDKRIFEARNIIRNAPDDGKQYSMLMNTAVELEEEIFTLITQQCNQARIDEWTNYIVKFQTAGQTIARIGELKAQAKETEQ
jgi:hypothetical protein